MIVMFLMMHESLPGKELCGGMQPDVPLSHVTPVHPIAGLFCLLQRVC